MVSASASASRWKGRHVQWDAGTIERPGKGDKLVRVPITDTIREIIWPLRGQHPRYVFTFVAERTIDKVIRGKRYRYTKGERYPHDQGRHSPGVERRAQARAGSPALTASVSTICATI